MMSQLRARMVFRYQARKDERGGMAAPEGDADGSARSDDDDDDGEDPERSSGGSADEDPADAAARLREELGIVRDERRDG